MSDRVLVATRKGLFTLERKSSGWTSRLLAFFAGAPVIAVLRDARDGALYAALQLGHFGVKLRAPTTAAIWKDCRRRPSARRGGRAGGRQIWTLEAGRRAKPGVLWAGTIPAGLFRSDDRGETWQLVSALWNVPERAKWFGGGYDDAGIHTDSPDPRDPEQLFVAISCGGVWDPERGKSWRLRGDGLIAAYMPPEQAGTREVQDPHRVARCAAAPDVMWMQHHNGIFRSTDAGVSGRRSSSRPRFRLCGGRASEGSADRLVRARDQGRNPRAARRRTVGHPHARRRRKLGSLRDGLPQRDAYDLVYRHGLDVDATGSGSRWARPPAASGSARMAASAGNCSIRTCRRSTRCGLRKTDIDPFFFFTSGLTALRPPSPSSNSRRSCRGSLWSRAISDRRRRAAPDPWS